MVEGDEQWTRLCGILRLLAKPIILELGAYDGWHTWALRRMSPGAVIYAFEPDPRCATEIRASVGVPSGAELIEAAIGSTTGTMKLHLSERNAGSSSQRASTQDSYEWGSSSIRNPGKCKEWFGLSFPRSVAVKSWTLDDWCESRGIEHIDLICADIQGAERDMIEHGRKALAFTDWLCVEIDPPGAYLGSWGRAEICNALKGWAVEADFGQDTLFRRIA